MKQSNTIRLVVLVVAIALIVVVARVLPVTTWLDQFNDWVAGAGTIGLVAFVAIYVVAAVALLPASVLTLGAGFVFGIVKGVILVSISATLGAAAAFLVSRHVARDAVKSRFARGERFGALDRAIAARGGRIVLLVRLSPLFPYNVLNYLLGVTAIPFWRFFLATWVGMLPGTLLYVYIGHVGRTGIEAASGDSSVDSLKLAYTIAGLLITAAVTFYVTRMARQALKEQAPAEAGEAREESIK